MEDKQEKQVEHQEYQYLRLVQDIIENGELREDRTGVGTLSKFGAQMRYSLENDVIPLFTTKKVFWKGVAEELLWFISGSTNALVLKEKGVKIWDGNSSREFLDKNGFPEREVGDLGPVYSFAWRHFGAQYKTMNTDYSGQGIDQLAQVIEMIQKDPFSRRIIMTAWNPTDVPLAALPPCHCFVQFFVSKNKELSCQMYQRSCDMGLGVPFNVASYSLLTRLIAQVCGLKAKEFIHTLGDAHVYLNHVPAMKEQLKRIPKVFPTLKINLNVKNIDDFKFSDLELIDYHPHPPIHMDMAV